MAIRAKVWHSVRRGDEGRRPRVAVALGLLVRPPRPGQSGRGGARGRVTLFQRRCWFGMSACLAPRSPTCRTKTGAPRQGGNRLTTQAGRTESIRSQQNAQFPSAVCCWQDGGNSRQARVLLLVHVDEHLHDLHALREKTAFSERGRRRRNGSDKAQRGSVWNRHTDPLHPPSRPPRMSCGPDVLHQPR
jgi:hypothetical protein